MSSGVTRKCPTCGRPLPSEHLLSRDDLLKLLRAGHDVYRVNHTNRWLVTRSGGEVAWETVNALIDEGLIVSAYSNCPHDMYRVGRTIDVERSLAKRKAKGKNADLVYVGDPPEVA